MQATLALSQRSIVAAVVTKKLKALPKKTTSVRPGTVTLKPGTTKKVGTAKVGTATKPAPPKPAPAPTTGGPRLLTRIQQLRLLSKVEQAGLLSLLEKNGLTLTAIEKSGALSTAESLGLLSAAADKNTPVLLNTLALLLFVAGPAVVYLTPDDSPLLIGVQVLVALTAILGGSAAFGGASLLSTLQK